jgi:tetratricopeptide (TPR) repeat protein
MHPSLDHHYAILQLKPGSSPAEVKRAYRRLARQWHPDRCQNVTAKAQAEAKFKEINQAYEALKDYIPLKPDPTRHQRSPHPPATTPQSPKAAPKPQAQPEPKPEPKPEAKSDPIAGQSMAELRSTADRLAQNQDYERAIAYLSSILKRYPQDAATYRYRGWLRLQLGFERSAAADREKAMRLERQAARPPQPSQCAIPPACDRQLMPVGKPLLTQTPVSALAVRADRTLLVTGSRTGRLQLWHLSSGQLYQTIDAHVGMVTGLVVRGGWLVSSGADGLLKLWRWRSQRGWLRSAQLICRQTITAHRTAINGLSHDQQSVYTLGEDRTLKQWHWGWRCLSASAVDRSADLAAIGNGATPTAMVFSPMDKRWAIGDAQGWINIWDKNFTQTIQTIPAHPGTVQAIAWSPNGTWLVSLGDDQMMRLWDSKTPPGSQSWETQNQRPQYWGFGGQPNRLSPIVSPPIVSPPFASLCALPNSPQFAWLAVDRQGRIQRFQAPTLTNAPHPSRDRSESNPPRPA